MSKKIYFALAFVVAVASALAFGGQTSTADRSAHHQQHASAEHVRRRAVKARKRVRRPVRYVCPMHLDVRSKSRSECPRCGMELIVERRRAKQVAALGETK